MLHTKFILSWSLIAAISLFAKPLNREHNPALNAKTPIKWLVEKTSTLKVSGKSNVSEFTCAIPGYYGTDTILLNEGDGSGKAVQLNGCLEIDVFKFDCHNRMITKDLRKTLKAEDYPKMTIRFLSLERMPSLNNNVQNIKGWVEVALAGERRCFQIPFAFVAQGPGSFVLNGKRVFCFSDFKLNPPQKLAGMIQVKDEFAVDFGLNMKTLN